MSFLNAQIQLNSSNFMYNTSTRNVLDYQSTVSTPMHGTSMSWDYGSVMDIPNSNSFNFVSNSGSFAGNPFSTSAVVDTFLFDYLNASAGYLYHAYYETTPTGNKGLGITIPEQRYGLGSLTGTMTDSLIFDLTHYAINPNVSYLPFPAQFGTTNVSQYVQEVTGKLNVPSFGLFASPVTKKSYFYYNDSIVGEGSIIAPTLAGPSMSYDVLLVKNRVLRVDSILQNGAPASPFLLQAFGLTQGGVSTINRYNFFRTGTTVPLMRLIMDSTYTTVNSFLVDGDLTTSSIAKSNSDKVTCFPNPFTNSVNFNFVQPLKSNSQLLITDIQGKLILSQNVNVNETKTTLNINAPTGMYLWKLVNQNGDFQASGKLIKE